MICKDCGQDKPKSAFHAHPAMAAGVRGNCKECRNACQRNYIHLKEQDLNWIAKERRRQVVKACSPAGLARMRRYRKENPERYKAHIDLNNAVFSGKIVKPKNCSRCGREERLHGHHADYSKPLEVEWLCVKCHCTERGT